MTGTLAKIGQGVAAMVFGTDGLEWLAYVALWAELVAGAIAGSALYTMVGIAALWLPASLSLVLAVTTRRFRIG